MSVHTRIVGELWPISLRLSNCSLQRCMCSCFSHSVVSDSVRPHGLWPARLLCPWDSPGKNTGVGGHGLLQGVFPTQGSNLCLLRPPALAGRFFTTSTTGKPLNHWTTGNSPVTFYIFVYIYIYAHTYI